MRILLAATIVAALLRLVTGEVNISSLFNKIN